jgi:NAD(P)-dependent dehydrogenase (short-subunit alcohol dehydrogenase family)
MRTTPSTPAHPTPRRELARRRSCNAARVQRVALVTGANRGIGLEVARGLAARGYRTLLGARDLDAGRAAADGIAGDVIPCRLDVTDAESLGAVAAGLDRLDVLVNNAGVLYDTWQRPSTADLDVVREALEVNLLGAWRMAEAVLPRMGDGGRIVNVSSGAGALAGMGAGTPAYGVSKAALNAFTLKLAAELRGRGILVNAVCPGWVATDMGGVGGRPVQEGAASVLWAVDLPDDGPTGGFFRDGRPIAW